MDKHLDDANYSPETPVLFYLLIFFPCMKSDKVHFFPSLTTQLAKHHSAFSVDFRDASLAAAEVEKEVKINPCFHLKYTLCALGPRMFVSIKDLCAVRSSKHVYFSFRISILIWLFGVSARFRKPGSSSHWRNWQRFWLSCTGFIFHSPNLPLSQGSFLD